MQQLRRVIRSRTRVFVSFDYDHDAHLARLIAGQAKLPGTPFQIENWSLKEAGPTLTWHIDAERRIKCCAVVLVLVGPHTHRAPGVRKEVAIANRLGVRVVQINGRTGTRPTPVAGAGRLHAWTWPNLKTLLAPPRRAA